MTLNYFKTSYVILTKLGIFYSIISLWHIRMFAARGLSSKLELLVNIEMFPSLLNWLYIIKENLNASVKYVFYFTREVKICIFHSYLRHS